jgi:ATP-dependent RNA helicase RhlE
LAQFKDGSMRVLVATDIAARGLDIDQLPQVVNFELPNVPEDYVHRIGRTGRAGSSGAAVSLVDREELKFLKDIEKLIKREIPKLPVEGFTPNPNPEPEAPRAPRQPHGRPPRGHQRSAGSSNQTQRPREANQAAPRGEPRPASNKNMSEAARHQAMPQPALFSPTVPQNNGRRHNPNGDQPRSNPSRPGQARTGQARPGQARPGQANHGKPSSPNRSGGRGR